MPSDFRQIVTIIGAGNVAHHLALAFHESGISIHQIFSRKISKAKRLAKKVNALPTNDLLTINSGADIFIIAVKDDAIGSVAQHLAKALKKENKLVVHTSGATPSIILKKHFKRYGVFYPLQTFSISRAADFRQIPICIDANRKGDRLDLEKLAFSISPKVQRINDREKGIIHVAAVLVNNFTNHLYTQAALICESENIDFNLLKPLIQETVSKIEKQAPASMQTGPAIRRDHQTIERHLKYLEKFPDIRRSYELLSQLIGKSE